MSLDRSRKKLVFLWFLFVIVVGICDLIFRGVWAISHAGMADLASDTVSTFFRSGEYLLVSLGAISASAWEMTREMHVIITARRRRPDLGDIFLAYVTELAAAALFVVLSGFLFAQVLNGEAKVGPSTPDLPVLCSVGYLAGAIMLASAWMLTVEKRRTALAEPRKKAAEK